MQEIPIRYLGSIPCKESDMTEQLSTHTHNTLLCALHAKSLQLRPTFCQPMDCSPPALLSMGFSRQEYWSGLPFPPAADLPNPGIKPTSPVSPALQADSLPAEPAPSRSVLLSSKTRNVQLNAEIICVKAVESCRGAGRGVNRSSERWSDSSSCSHLLSQQELRIWGQRNQRICHQDTGALQYTIRFPFSVFPELGVYEAWQLEGKNRKPLKIMFSEVSQEENQSPGPANFSFFFFGSFFSREDHRTRNC